MEIGNQLGRGALELFVKHARGFLDELEALLENGGQGGADAIEESPSLGPGTSFSGPAEAGEPKAAAGGLYTAEQLAAISFNDLRSLGAKLGVNAGGNRASIEANILALSAGGAANAAESGGDAPAQAEKGGAASETENEAPEEEEAGEEDEQGEPSQEDEIRRACEGMTDAELQEALKSAGQRASGKRAALIDRIVKAVADGILDWTEDEEEDGAAAGEEGEAWRPCGDFAELAANDPSKCEITPARLAKLAEIDAMRDDGGESEAEMDGFLAAHFGSGYDPKAHGTAGRKALLYCEVMKLYVDDDGDEHDAQEAYYLNDALYCCAKPVDAQGACAVCGDEYDLGGE